MANFTIEQINSRLTTDAKNVIEQAANLLGLSGTCSALRLRAIRIRC